MKDKERFTIDLQWFADEDLEFEEEEGEEEGDPEIVELEEGEEAPKEEEGEETEGISLSKEEYERLLGKSESNEKLNETLQGLQDVINKPSGNKDGEEQRGEQYDPEEFKKKFNEELFGDDPYKAMREFITKEVGPYVNQGLQNDAQLNKKLLLVDPEKGEYARKYKKEIEDYVDDLPKNQQSNPRVWEYAYDEVIKNKQDDIVNEKVEKRVNEILKKKGLSDSEEEEGEPVKKKKKAGRPAGGQKTGQVSKGSRKKQVYVSEDDKRIAREKGLTLEDYLFMEGRI